MKVRSLLRHPSAFLPLLMSVLALLTLAIALALHGGQRQPDEGAAAHIWQLLIGGQLPIIAFFALRWVRDSARTVLLVLGLQVLLLLFAMAPVYLLRL